MSYAGILHADLDSFYASVEQRDDPRLRGRPVIVGGGVVLSCSYEARAMGVRGAMGGRQARELCPQAIVVPPRIDAYVEASKATFAIFEDTTPLVEGKVSYVSADRLTEANRPDLPYYVVHVEVAPRALADVGLKLQAGMPAEIFMRTDARTAFDYLAAPVTAYLRRGMREPL